jgi:hypothetical protein
MEPQQLEDICNEIQDLHKPMKNVIEVVFATSPLLALSTHGWRQKASHSTYLLRVGAFAAVYSKAHVCQKIFSALGNNRPQILVQIEDFVLQAIISISEGKPCDEVLDTLCSQVSSSENSLQEDEVAMNWFNFSTSDLDIPSRPIPSEIPSTPFAGQSH